MTGRVSCVILNSGGSGYRLDSGEIKMVLDLLDPATLGRVVGMVVLMVLAAAYGYSKGHRDGSREGYTRGRAVSRHISTINKAVK